MDLFLLHYGENLQMKKLSKTYPRSHAVRPSGRVCYCDESHRRKLKQKMCVRVCAYKYPGRFDSCVLAARSSAPGPFIS